MAMDTSMTTSSQDGEFERDIDDLDMILNDIGISDRDLIVLSTKQLNKLIEKRGISKEGARTIKNERRTLKNRIYAANSRVKRENIDKRNKAEIEELAQKLEAAYVEIQLLNVSITPDHQIIKELEELEALRNKASQLIRAPEALGQKAATDTALSRLRFKPTMPPTIAADIAKFYLRGYNSVESLLASKPEIRFEKICEEH